MISLQAENSWSHGKGGKKGRGRLQKRGKKGGVPWEKTGGGILLL